MKRSMFKMATAIIASAAMLTSVAACGRTSATSDSADDVTTIDSAKATGDLTIWAMGNEGDLLGEGEYGCHCEGDRYPVVFRTRQDSDRHRGG